MRTAVLLPAISNWLHVISRLCLQLCGQIARFSNWFIPGERREHPERFLLITDSDIFARLNPSIISIWRQVNACSNKHGGQSSTEATCMLTWRYAGLNRAKLPAKKSKEMLAKKNQLNHILYIHVQLPLNTVHKSTCFVRDAQTPRQFTKCSTPVLHAHLCLLVKRQFHLCPTTPPPHPPKIQQTNTTCVKEPGLVYGVAIC